MSNFFHTNQYLDKFCKKITQEEARKHLDEGTGYVGRGGYTFCNPEGKNPCYFAEGVFPGCLRGGLHLIDKHEEWYLMSLKDVICTHGFYPNAHLTSIAAIMQHDMNDYEVHIEDLIKYCIDSEVHSSHFKHPLYSPKIWQEYFHRKGLLDGKES